MYDAFKNPLALTVIHIHFVVLQFQERPEIYHVVDEFPLANLSLPFLL